jgi:hypothetical protein
LKRKYTLTEKTAERTRIKTVRLFREGAKRKSWAQRYKKVERMKPRGLIHAMYRAIRTIATRPDWFLMTTGICCGPVAAADEEASDGSVLPEEGLNFPAPWFSITINRMETMPVMLVARGIKFEPSTSVL